MVARENSEQVRKGYEDLSKGDIETVANFCSPDLRWYANVAASSLGFALAHSSATGYNSCVPDQRGGRERGGAGGCAGERGAGEERLRSLREGRHGDHRRCVRQGHRVAHQRSEPVAGTYNGQDEVFPLFERLAELTGGTFNIEIHDLLASDDHVVVLTKDRATRNGTTMEADEVHVWHVTDGKAVEFWSIARDQHANDEFWG
jgi:ketosteroid isomerase-like protein